MPIKVKGFRQKQLDGSYSNFTPFGTDGILVDMLSGLDNEQELKLGGNHDATIIESVNASDEKVTTITELFKDNSLEPVIKYSLITEITEHEDTSTTIICSLYTEDNINSTPLHVKTITIPATGTTNFTIEEVLS